MTRNTMSRVPVMSGDLRQAYRSTSDKGLGFKVLSALFVSLVVACGGDSATAPPASQGEQYWALRLNEHAVTLSLTAPYDTVQLRARALDPDGRALANGGDSVRPIYSTADEYTTVSRTGLVSARKVTPSGVATSVIATYTVDNVTLADTVSLIVTADHDASPLTAFSIEPAETDSNHMNSGVDPLVFGGNFHKTVVVRASRQNGDTINDSTNSTLLTYFTSSDPKIARIDKSSGRVEGFLPGTVTLTASTRVYGVSRQDSLRFRVDESGHATVSVYSRTLVGNTAPELAFGPAAVTIAAGGSVTWDSQITMPVDVIFDDPPGPINAFCTILNIILSSPCTDRGNIVSFQAPSVGEGETVSTVIQSRAFPVAGTYRYHSAQYGTAGAIIVKSASAE